MMRRNTVRKSKLYLKSWWKNWKVIFHCVSQLRVITYRINSFHKVISFIIKHTLLAVALNHGVTTILKSIARFHFSLHSHLHAKSQRSTEDATKGLGIEIATVWMTSQSRSARLTFPGWALTGAWNSCCTILLGSLRILSKF